MAPAYQLGLFRAPAVGWVCQPSTGMEWFLSPWAKKTVLQVDEQMDQRMDKMMEKRKNWRIANSALIVKRKTLFGFVMVIRSDRPRQ